MGRNRLTNIHASTFKHNIMLNYIDIHSNKITSIHPDLFSNNEDVDTIDLHDNRIGDIDSSTFRNNDKLRSLDLARNQITVIHSGTFIHSRELRFLYIQQNKITEIRNSSFPGLEQLQEFDLSTNNIEELNPLVFHNTLNSTNRQYHQVSKLKRFNLAQNMIQTFNLDFYFPMSRKPFTFNPTFQLNYLNLSSNRLTTLDVASMKWLNDTTADTDLTGNPWNCDCSVLIEMWRGLKHKLKLQCGAPTELRGMSWDVMANCLSKPADDKTNGDFEPSVLTTTLIVIGVLLVCAIVLGLILAKVVNCRRKRPKTPEYCDVYAPTASDISHCLYEYIDAGPSHITDQT
jgi:hypothetical protein